MQIPGAREAEIQGPSKPHNISSDVLPARKHQAFPHAIEDQAETNASSTAPFPMANIMWSVLRELVNKMVSFHTHTHTRTYTSTHI